VTRVGAVVDVDVVEPDVVPDDVVLADFSEV
jgi:hypothetical protein